MGEKRKIHDKWKIKKSHRKKNINGSMSYTSKLKKKPGQGSISNFIVTG